MPSKPRESSRGFVRNFRNLRANGYPAVDTRIDSLDNSYYDEDSKSFIYEKKKLPPLPKSASLMADKPFSSAQNPVKVQLSPAEEIEMKKDNLFMKDLDRLLQVATQRRIEEENKLKMQKESECAVQ